MMGPVSTLSRWRDEALNLDFLSGVVSDLLTHTRAGTALYTDAKGMLRTAAINQPRIDYDPETGQARGLLLEGASTNLLRNSYFRAGDSWNAVRGTLQANVGLAPDGTSTLSRFVHDATTNPYCFPGATNSVQYTANVKYTASGFFKLDPNGKSRTAHLVGHQAVFGQERSIAVNLKTGAVTAGSAAVERWGFKRYPGNFVHVWMTNTAATSGSSYPLIVWCRESFAPGDVADFWGLDLKADPYLTSHIPTLGAAASRAADVSHIDGARFASWFNQAQGTFVFDGVNLAYDIGDTTLMVVDDGSTGQTNQVSIRTSASGITWRLTTRAHGQAVFDAGMLTNPVGSRGRFGFSYGAPAGWEAAVSSGLVLPPTAGTLPVGMSRLRFGSRGTGAINALLIRNIRYWPRAMDGETMKKMVQL